MPNIASSNPPEFQQYVAAFRAIDNLTDNHIQMLQVHYHAQTYAQNPFMIEKK